MEDKTTIVIDVQLNDTAVAEQIEKNRQAVQNLTDQNKLLREEIKNGRDEDGKYAAQLAKNEQELKKVKAESSALAGQVKQLNTDTKSYGSSMKEQAALLNALKDQYRSLTAEERAAGDVGGKLLHDIEALDAEVKKMEGSIGNFQRNVGGYAHVMESMRKSSKEVKDGLEGMGIAAGGFDKTMKLITTNPWMFLISSLIGIIIKLKDNLKGTEKVTEAFKKATDALSPVLELFGKWVSKIADLLVNVLNWAIDGAIKAIGGLGKVLQKVGGWFGKDWGGGLIEYSENMAEARQKTEEVTVAVEEADTAFHSYGDTMKEVTDATSEYIDVMDLLLQKYQEQKKAEEDTIKRMADLREMFRSMVNTWDETSESWGRFKEAADAIGTASLPQLAETTDKAKERLRTFNEFFTENAKNIEQTVVALGQSFGSLSSMYDKMAKDESKSEAEREKAAKNAKRWSALQIAANSGTALAKGISGAMEAEPWPAKIAALATIMASVLSAVAQAKALAAEGHEQGGVLGGKFIGATTGPDTMVFRGRPGELVLNAQQQRQLYEIANGGNVTGGMTAALAEAISNMPAPVLVYSEFCDFQRQVQMLENNSKLQ